MRCGGLLSFDLADITEGFDIGRVDDIDGMNGITCAINFPVDIYTG